MKTQEKKKQSSEKLSESEIKDMNRLNDSKMNKLNNRKIVEK